jgi:hypothetical protein
LLTYVELVFRLLSVKTKRFYYSIYLTKRP